MAPFMRMSVSNIEGDLPRIPNHHCTGRDCLVYLTKGRTVAASLLQKCSTTPRRWTCSDSHAEPAIPPFSGGCQELSSCGMVHVMPTFYGSEPEPQHECRMIPCDICGRTWF